MTAAHATSATTETTVPAGTVRLDGDLVWVDLGSLDDTALRTLAADALAEQHRRALADGDIDAVVTDAFGWGFTGRDAAAPRIVGALLVCPGWLSGRSDHHDCTFVSVQDRWCWEHEDRIADEVVRDERGQRSVTVLPAVEGTHLTQVSSRARRGLHTARGQRSWRITNGHLEPTAPVRSPRTVDRT